MQTETPRRSTTRLTRRGRVAMTVTGAVVAATAVAVPLALAGEDEANQVLTIPEGWRSGQVYEAVDKALDVPAGTTKKAAPKAHLKLPGDAGGNAEGYLFPATYPLSDESTPQSVLSYMVGTANKRFGGSGTTAGAERKTVNPYQRVIIASIVQAEADNKEDMGRVARVIYNRLDHGMPLQMDSTINYALGRSTLDTTHDDTKINNPYNTYARKGLPPTPIGNPGEQAMRAATSPTSGDWLYFVTVKPGDTRFTADLGEQEKNVAEFNKNQAKAKKDG
ncbi:endolytic transglycosylase MltG [Streptomyces endophyticus]|uniref:Endolytic murein transglycosylase n=1 Tax=Streptomyces endophyticus TaxID=714166 RepID=A0ABU6EZQ6_9ACTN|nr:endolytic transglycosylase MltG [Streptomyces endophyticus]MEB8337223.1 endolytic transglycosylase MltG [Streptomyces endophyticus]